MYRRLLLPLLTAMAALAAPARVDACGIASATARPASVADSQKRFVWPARGAVIFSLCDDRRSGAIDIAAPPGADVYAAESGRVVYAGHDLKRYGNLIIVVHDGGWVSTYAFAEGVKVNRGDQVERGQVIATVGAIAPTGQPGLHFELLHGGHPVEPLAYLEGSHS